MYHLYSLYVCRLLNKVATSIGLKKITEQGNCYSLHHSLASTPLRKRRKGLGTLPPQQLLQRGMQLNTIIWFRCVINLLKLKLFEYIVEVYTSAKK